MPLPEDQGLFVERTHEVRIDLRGLEKLDKRGIKVALLAQVERFLVVCARIAGFAQLVQGLFVCRRCLG
jgi:hypothetical protein